MNRILETPRLYLREITIQDLSYLIDLHQDLDVMKYIGPPRDPEETAGRFKKVMQQYIDEPGFGVWMACQLQDDVRIGWACFKDLDGSKHIEVGYRLAVNYWGRGYATELARALVDYGFQNHPLKKISGVTHPENKGSMAVLRKAGLTYRRKAHYYNCEVNYFSITRQSWTQNQD